MTERSGIDAQVDDKPQLPQLTCTKNNANYLKRICMMWHSVFVVEIGVGIIELLKSDVSGVYCMALNVVIIATLVLYYRSSVG